MEGKVSWRRMCNVPLSPVTQSLNISSSSDNSEPQAFTSSSRMCNVTQSQNISSSSDNPEPQLTISEDNVDGTMWLPSPTPSDPYAASDSDSDYVPGSVSEDSEYGSEGNSDRINNMNKPKIKIISNILVKPAISENLPHLVNESRTSNSAEEVTATTKKNEKDYCFFCEDHVLNFARHIIRNHGVEVEVQKILSFPPKSKTRKDLISALRKKGNFVDNNESGKAIKKAVLNTKLLPCKHCLGFYSSKSLWKHIKRCKQAKNPNTRSAQSDAQSFICRNLEIDVKLRDTVFPRMQADEISIVAKKDQLICAYGSRYLKIHREKHFVNVVSRKMRELSRLVIEAKKLDSSIKFLLDALRPEKYDILIGATKSVAKYNTEKEFYESPTLALNMGTVLKQCCEIAIMNVMKKSRSFQTSHDRVESDFQSLIKLIEAHWRFDISSQAGTDLNIKKWNKVTLLPLAGDLKLLKDFLVIKGNEAQQNLECENPDQSSYLTLMETVYCRVILLNRRRPGELQRLLLHTYQLETSNFNCEELGEMLSTTEKLLTKSFKRIVVRGKRGRGVPVLFSTDVQNHLDTLLKVREKFVPKLNIYLFGNPGTVQPILGYKVLKKYANSCGAKNPNAITCTKLRKHLATLTQLFNMSENDMEQLSNFMGHTLSVHRQNYRLPDDVYQTARVSKLLMLMEKGEAGPFKGKSLEEIELDMNENLLEGDNYGEEKDELDTDDVKGHYTDANDIMATSSKNSCKEPIVLLERFDKPSTSKKKRVLIPWTEEQKKIALKRFAGHITSKKPPKRNECEELINKYAEVFHNKDWLKMKVFIQNAYTYTKKQK